MEYQYGQNNENNNYQGHNDYIYYHNQPAGNIPPEPAHKKKEKKSGKGIIPLCLVLSLMMGTAGGALGSGLVMQQYNKKEVQSEEAPQQAPAALPQTTEQAAITPTAATAATGLSIEQISEMCLPSVVAITNITESEIRSFWGTTYTQEIPSSGSGVIIGKTDDELLIVTNYHVVSGNKELNVLFSYQESQDTSDAEIVQAEVKDYNSSKDLAVIAVPLSSLTEEVMNNIKVAAIGDSNELALGEQVVAIGNALGYGQSVTTGIISALNRNINEGSETDTVGNANQYIQTDAAINPGNSGGALFNMKGELVGINSAKMADTKVEGMGYAIPISDIKADMENMMQRETRMLVEEPDRGYLGISGSNVTEEINQSYDIPIGAHISSVTAGSPAEKAGLERGMVITEIDGKSVRTIEELKEYLAYYRAGETIDITVSVRTDSGYEDRTYSVTLCTAEEAGITIENTQTQDQDQSSGSQYGQTSPYDQTNPFGGFFPFFGN